MKRLARHSRLAIKPAGAIFGLVITCLLVVIVHGLIGSGRTDTAKGPPGSEVASAPASPITPPERSISTQVSQLKRRTKAFVKTFYSYDSSLTATSQRRAVRSYATDRFMRKTFFGLVPNQANRDIRSGKIEMHGQVKSILPTEFFNRGAAVSLPVVLTMIATGKDGQIVDRFDRQVEMTWIKRPGKAWLIDSLSQ